MHLFTVRGIAVYVEPWFFMLLVLMVVSAASAMQGLIWAVCVSFSILIHEFGHAVVARGFKLGPTIVLHGWGGKTMHAPARRDGHDALIIAAGPTAGLLLGALVYGAWFVVERQFPDVLASRPLVLSAIDALLYVNLFWSLVNLIPMFPLDGGLLFRLGAYKLLSSTLAERLVHGLGFALAVGWCGAGWMIFKSPFLALMGLMFAFDNIAVLTGSRRAPEARVPPPQMKGQLTEIRQVWEAKDARETVRLCHVLRTSGPIAPEVAREVYTRLVVANVALGEHEEALSWLRYAPTTPAVVEAQINALLALNRTSEAREVLAQSGAMLSAALRAELEGRSSG